MANSGRVCVLLCAWITSAPAAHRPGGLALESRDALLKGGNDVP